jgi:hypothetical protein
MVTPLVIETQRHGQPRPLPDRCANCVSDLLGPLLVVPGDSARCYASAPGDAWARS